MKLSVKRGIIAATIAAAGIVPVAGVVSAASASTLPVTSNSQTGQATGQHAFKYLDPAFGNVKVNETQHPKFDTVGGTLLDGPRADLAGTSGDLPWASDFNSTAGTLHYTVNADGTGYTGQATYPAG